MFDDDQRNDAIDAQIQAAIGNARGNTLQGMTQMDAPPAAGGDASTDAITQAMIEEDEAAEAAKKQGGGGGGMGGIMEMVGGMAGG